MSVTVPPIMIVALIASLKRNHAMMDANMGSPIGVDATTVGETYRIAKYIEPCPSSVGIIPSRSNPMKSILEYPNKDELVKNEIINKVMAAVVKSVRE